MPILVSASDHPSNHLECELSLYAVNLKDGTIGQRIISPEQVTSAKFIESDILENSTALKVALNPAGEKANKVYTSNNIGSKLAIFCNGQELTRVTIASRSEGHFVIEGVAWPSK